jgi:hypothetical protein
MRPLVMLYTAFTLHRRRNAPPLQSAGENVTSAARNSVKPRPTTLSPPTDLPLTKRTRRELSSWKLERNLMTGRAGEGEWERVRKKTG